MFLSYKSEFCLEHRDKKCCLVTANYINITIKYHKDNGTDWIDANIFLESQKRNWNIGENLALYLIYRHQLIFTILHNDARSQSLLLKDFENWEEIEKKRDKYLQKYLLLE